MIAGWRRDLLDAVAPPRCEVCGRPLVDGEDIMCLHCDADLPRTHWHRDPFNKLHRRMDRDSRVDRATSWFYYRTGSPYTALVKLAKYRDRRQLGVALGRRYASELLPTGFFDGIDIILPVPMHILKRLRRGYNQATEIAAGISDVTGIPVGDNLIAIKGHSTQTFLNAFTRYKNVASIFAVKHPRELDNLHILIVDDVTTTGSTLCVCCETLRRQAPTCRLSVLTLGSATL